MKAMYVDWGRLLLGRRDCACRGRQWEGEHCKVTENDFRANTPHLPPPFSHFLIVKKTSPSQLLPPTICFTSTPPPLHLLPPLITLALGLGPLFPERERDRERRATRPNGERGYSTRCQMLGRECPEAVLPDRALYLPTFSHFLIVNNILSLFLSRSLSLSLSLSLSRSQFPGARSWIIGVKSMGGSVFSLIPSPILIASRVPNCGVCVREGWGGGGADV